MTAPPNDRPTPDIPDLWMPGPEADAVRAAYRAARRIVEYGAGGSTVFAARETEAQLLSIESDPDWTARVQVWTAETRGRVIARHVDIGPVGRWGVPKGPGGFRKYPGYALSPWVDPVFDAPDLVMIDGRFRLACFAATLLNATAPLRVLWDDYADRPGYHAAETLLAPTRMIGRLAQFDLTPRTLSAAEISRIIPWFVIPG